MLRLGHTISHGGRMTAVALIALLAPLAALGCSDPGRSDSTLLDELERIWAPSGAESPLRSARPSPPAR